MPKAAVIHEKGGPDVFRYEDVEVGDPGSGEVHLKHTAIGVNYADTYHRGGVSHPWPVGEPPVIVGFEAAGEVLDMAPASRTSPLATRWSTGCRRLAPIARSAFTLSRHSSISRRA